MQIMLNQDEIEESIRNHVLSQLAIRDDQEISIDLRAGRGENGFTATLDIRARQTATNQPKQGPRLVQPEPNIEAPREDKTDISTQRAEEPKPTSQEVASSTTRAIEAANKKEKTETLAAAGPTKKAATKKAEAEAPKKGQGKSIFASAPKTASRAAEEAQPEENTANDQAEESIPDQETPAEEAAREDAQESAQEEASASNPFAGDEDGDEAPAEVQADETPAEKTEPKKSIFAFAPKKSAG